MKWVEIELKWVGLILFGRILVKNHVSETKSVVHIDLDLYTFLKLNSKLYTKCIGCMFNIL